ncbi:hypothetical protein Hypma_015264 [Hypsizygus marmoreus]|uniref:Uncharacterized protein n=1 Tax=Hypsizygus marmoreus TaxID=39966 RepID=A0A369KDD6_HYPMA|nr:hypothetical protein Hypma_015264 [Hypsizygus marmoreus]
MPPTLTSSFSNFLGSLWAIAISLFNSIVAVFQAILALGMNIIQSVLAVGQQLVALVLNVFQGLFGFIAANIVAIGLIGLGYYLYTQRQARRGR